MVGAAVKRPAERPSTQTLSDASKSMVQRPTDDDDPTGEEEALQFDGTSTTPLDDTYRLRVVIASESPNGTVAFDERGQAQWKWITELTPASPDASDTFDLLKALDAPKLRLKDDAPPAPEPTAKTGYDPYATGVFQKPKIPPMTARDAKQPSTDASPGELPRQLWIH